MNCRLLRVVSGALVVVFVAAPGAAITAVASAHPATLRAVNQSAIRPGGSGVPSRVAASRQIPTVSVPSGCSASGPSSFVGENGAAAPGPATNWAGGAHVNGGYAAVVAGQHNESCDYSTLIGAGTFNTIGGDGSAIYSAIGGGNTNRVEQAMAAFIGAGYGNLLGAASPYGSGTGSAIVSGSKNTLGSPFSFIGAGSANSITGSSVDSSGNGQSAFIGAGYKNAVAGNFAGIVSGQSNSVHTSDSSIVGGSGNSIDVAPSAQSFALGTGAFIGGGFGNVVSGDDSIIVGGNENSINAPNGFVGSGWYNRIGAGAGDFNVIPGGYGNEILGSDPGFYDRNTIGGGDSNAIQAEWATIAGGDINIVTGEAGAIGGGAQNQLHGDLATIGGGGFNTANGVQSSIGGGYGNTAAGRDATIPGGASNVASGANSFAAGTKSVAASTGAFVWSDASSAATQLSSSAANQFLARSAGGFYFYSSANLKSGVKLAPGSGSWSSLSDRATKTAVQNVDDARILAKVASLPVSEWSYKEQGTGVRHLGPMAQDFRAAFGLGEDDKHISAVDEEGVALAAVKALQAEVATKDRTLSALDEKYARLERRLEALEARSRS